MTIKEAIEILKIKLEAIDYFLENCGGHPKVEIEFEKENRDALQTLLTLALSLTEEGKLEGIIARVYCEDEHSKKVLDANLIKSIATAIRKELGGKDE